MMKYVLTFCLMILLDYGWAKYISNVSAKKALPASLWSVTIYLIGAVLTLLVVEDHAIIIPATLGTLTGTYVAVKRESKK